MILAVAYISNFFIPLNIEHITERLANFVVLVLGEDVASLFFVETGGYSSEPCVEKAGKSFEADIENFCWADTSWVFLEW